MQTSKGVGKDNDRGKREVGSSVGEGTRDASKFGAQDSAGVASTAWVNKVSARRGGCRGRQRQGGCGQWGRQSENHPYLDSAHQFTSEHDMRTCVRIKGSPMLMFETLMNNVDRQ